MLLNPFEEQLYSPARFVKVSNSFWRQREIVSQEYQALVGFLVTVDDAPKVVRIISSSVNAT